MSREPFPPLRRFVRPIGRLGTSRREHAHASDPRATRLDTGPGLLTPFIGLLGSRLSPSPAAGTEPGMLALTLAPLLRERVERETHVVREHQPKPDSEPERFGSLLRGESSTDSDSADRPDRVLAWRTDRVHTRETTVRPERSAAPTRSGARDDPPSLLVRRSFPTRVERLTRDVRVVRDRVPATNLSPHPGTIGGPRPAEVAPDSSGRPGWGPSEPRGLPAPDRAVDAPADAPTTLPPSLAPTTSATESSRRADLFDGFSLTPRGAHRPGSDETDLPPLVVRPTPSPPGAGFPPVAPAATTGAAGPPDTSTVAETGGSMETRTPVAGDGRLPHGPSTTAVAVEGPNVVDALFAQRTTVDRLVDRLYVEFERKLRIERERRGLRGGT